jgi:hypothetical protein
MSRQDAVPGWNKACARLYEDAEWRWLLQHGTVHGQLPGP